MTRYAWWRHRKGEAPRSRRRRQALGQAIAEMAILAPILLVLFAATIDLGRLFYSQITIANAAREGALAAAQDPTKYEPNQNCVPPSHGPDQNRVVCAVSNETRRSFVTVVASGISMKCDGVVVTTTAQVVANCHGTMGHTVAVTVVGQFTLATPFLSNFTGSQSIALSSTATAIPREVPPPPPPAPTPTPTPTPTPVPTPTPTPTPDPLATPTPTPNPLATPTPTPAPTPTPTPVPTPTPTPVPSCFAPTASFYWSPTQPVKKTVVQFTDTSTNMTPGQCAAQWTWSFGDQSGGSTLRNPPYSYTKQGNYIVTLLVSNSAGSDTKQQTIRVVP